jgi:predicted GTPase
MPRDLSDPVDREIYAVFLAMIAAAWIDNEQAGSEKRLLEHSIRSSVLSKEDKTQLRRFLRLDRAPVIEDRELEQVIECIRPETRENLLINLWMVVLADKKIRPEEELLFRRFGEAFQISESRLAKIQKKAKLKTTNHSPILQPRKARTCSPSGTTFNHEISRIKNQRRDAVPSRETKKQLEILTSFSKGLERNATPQVFDAVERATVGELRRAHGDTVCEIAIVGVTASGKTALINAILGRQLLPEDVRATTNVVTHIIPDSNQRVEISYDDGKNTTIRLDDERGFREATALLCEITDEVHNPGNKLRVKAVDGVRIYIDTPLLPPFVRLADTPGLNAGNMFSHEKIAVTYFMERPDAMLYLFSIKNNFKATDFETIRQVTTTGRPVIFVQNMIDALRPTRRFGRVRESAKQKLVKQRDIVLRRIRPSRTEKVRLFQISARLAGQAIEQESASIEADWRYRGFIEVLEELSVLGDEVLTARKVLLQLALLDFLGKARNDRKRKLDLSRQKTTATDAELNSTIDRYRTGKKALAGLVKEHKERKNTLSRRLANTRDQVRDSISGAHVSKSNHEGVSRRLLQTYVQEAQEALKEFERFKTKAYKKISGVVTSLPNFHEPFSPPSVPRIKAMENQRVPKKGAWSWVKRQFGASSGWESVERFDRALFDKNCKAALQRIHTAYSNYLQLVFNRLGERALEPTLANVEKLAGREKKLKSDLADKKVDQKRVAEEIKAISKEEDWLSELF